MITSGVTILNGATFIPLEVQSGNMRTGAAVTVIDNTAATAIFGTFAGLPDGGTLTIGRNTLQANYEGADGNDLTLTVVP